jgi:ribose transport system substrate-binding protein
VRRKRFMKKLTAAVMVLLTLALAGAAWAADDVKDTVGKDPAKKEYYFVFVPKLVHPFYEPIKKGFEAAIEEYAKDGIKITWDWDAPAAADAVLQTEKIEQVMAKGPDVIGVAVQEPAVIDKVVGEVEAAGIPVVLFADDTFSGTGSAFVGIKDYTVSGEVMGELLAKSINYKGEVGLLLGTLTAQSHTERIQGIKKELAKYPDIKIVAEQASDDNLEKAVQETEKMLNAYPNLSAVISGDGSGAAGAARAIVDSGKKGKVLVFGFDDIDENLAGIRDGSIVATYAQDAFSTGYYTLKAMVSVADRKITNANKVSIESDNRLLTIDTLAQYGY